MKKIAIVGASRLQLPLIEKAKEMGIETHVFAWAANDVGEKAANFFYPISIVEKEKILEKCMEIKIDGICSIASDLAVNTVSYVADAMKLIGNSVKSAEISTNKHMMRMAFEKNGDPAPKSILVTSSEDICTEKLQFPIIIKPTDRSGSRGITKLLTPNGINDAIDLAINQSFEKKALIEEFAVGQEYSVECISYEGEHTFLAMTHKFTTGTPHFIETGHLEPAPVDDALVNRVKKIVFHALDSLEIEYGASHSELKIAPDGTISIIEIGGRMGGDYIGSNLVELSTGVDFVKAVIQIALGEAPDLNPKSEPKVAAVRFVFDQGDKDVFENLCKEHPEMIVLHNIDDIISGTVTDSSTRFGVYLFAGNSYEDISGYLPQNL